MKAEADVLRMRDHVERGRFTYVAEGGLMERAAACNSWIMTMMHAVYDLFCLLPLCHGILAVLVSLYS
jgi:hypothetical protein